MKRGVEQEVLKGLVRSFFIQIFIYTVVVLFISAGGYFLCAQKIWHGTEPLYPMVHFLHDEWLGTFLFCLLMGCMVIACIHFFRIARMMGQIVRAVDDLANDRVSYIVLSRPLHAVESQLNEILWQMRQSKQAEREAEQQKNDMIVFMAHDLKTPLTSVTGYLELLKEEELNPEIRKRYLGIVCKKAERLEDLINELFEAAKYNFSQMALQLSHINLSMMLSQILYEFHPMFAEKGLTCRTDIEPELMFRCDADKMERVFDNLFKNAVNYCYEKTEIVVCLKQTKENALMITVQNCGNTIPKEKLEHLFDQFFRVDSSRNSETGGSGLGLAIAKKIITMHHGTIMCESAEDKILFTIMLPMMPDY